MRVCRLKVQWSPFEGQRELSCFVMRFRNACTVGLMQHQELCFDLGARWETPDVGL